MSLSTSKTTLGKLKIAVTFVENQDAFMDEYDPMDSLETLIEVSYAYAFFTISNIYI